MIKFFRKIRQRLLTENKFSKYLIYAIGEIVLVVIGILIALQIDNWNQKEQLKKEQLKTLNSLYESIKINVAEFDSIFNAQVLRNRSLREVVFKDISNQTNTYLDSLITLNVRNYTFDPSTGIYNAMINSGKIELITNDSLKNRISKLYDIVKDYQESEDEITEYTKEHLEKYFINNYSIKPEVLAGLRDRTEYEEQKDKASYIKVFQSSKVENMYILLLNKMSEVMLKGLSLKSEYEHLIDDLEHEIQKCSRVM
ncbi:hypothetical protein KIM67_13910 [Flagellimonas sp. 389]|uniref:DUF6090 family protein n=1 Tax=Flagellimonas sp. 389 TaxID=2835862 RepID=UPI001BD420CF|nr:DUF6090 family protein [Flagellimonas sp. 389]MBS9463509.1 hypothetical protein [Flagellimonas sp. 389]